MAKALIISSSNGCWFADLAVIVVIGWRDCILCHRHLSVLITPRPVGFKESIDRRIAWFVHAVTVIILKPNNESGGDALDIYLRSVRREVNK